MVPNLSPVTELVDFVEAHEHLHTILVSEQYSSWRVKNLVVVHELETCSFPARFGEVQLSLQRRESSCPLAVGGSGDLEDSASTDYLLHVIVPVNQKDINADDT
ncbi:hypothetical protein Tco_0059638 [Tanacetum coccineum]